METWWQDAAYAVRLLARRPTATIVAVVTLALALGANTAVFSVVNAFVLRPMPVRNAERLVVVAALQRPGDIPSGLVSYLDYLDYRSNSRVFEELAAYRLANVGFATDARADRVMVSYVTSNFFSMLGVQPTIGRLIRPGEGDAIGTGPVVVLGHAYWLRRFGGSPSIVGQAIRVNGQACTVVGVVPPTFIGAAPFIEMEAYLPIGMSGVQPARREALTRRDRHAVHVLGYLARGVVLAQAQASLDLVTRQLEQQYSDTNTGVAARVIPEVLARPEPSFAQQNPLIAAVFLSLGGLVLLVASLNLTNLSIVSVSLRRKELALRAALGAGRARLVRQLLTESLLLAALGTVAGALVGSWVSGVLASIHLPTEAIPVRFDFRFDWRTFAYVTVLGLIAALIIGIAPARRASRADLNDALRDGGRLASIRGRRSLRDLLVAGQVAASLVLLVVAGLFLRSLGSVQEIDLGFQPDGVLNASMDVSTLGYDEARGRAFFRELKERVLSLPGVRSASWAWSVPLGYTVTCEDIDVEGRVVATDEHRPSASCNLIDPDYFDTMGVKLRRGRGFTEHDTDGSRRVAVVNETMARRLWPGQDAIGRRMSYTGSTGPWLQVVGIVADGKYDFIFEAPAMHFYAPMAQHYRSGRTLHVRVTGIPPERLGPLVQHEIRKLDPDLPAYDVQTMKQSLEGGNGFFLPRMGATFAGVLGGLGLLLAVLGVYGVVSYSASERTSEIGLRIALGARPPEIRALVLRQALGIVVVGLGSGLALSLLAARSVSGLVAGVSAGDATTFGGLSLLMATVVLAASWVPARRATRVDPLVALRQG